MVSKDSKYWRRLCRQYIFLLCCTVLFAPGDALSQSRDDLPIHVRNAGGFSCSDVGKVLRVEGNELEKTAFLQWSASYLTAAARANGIVDTFPLIDTWEMVKFTALTCDEFPSSSYENALRIGIGRLQPYWIRQSTEVLNLQDPLGRSVVMYAEAVLKLQQDLNELGAQIAPDGIYGNQTAEAIQALNVARNTMQWSTPDGELLYQLTRNN